MKPLNPVVFPNAGSALVKALKDESAKWESHFPVLENVRIATLREGNDNQIIVLPVASILKFNGTAKLQGYNINLFGKSYEDVENMGTALEVVLQAVQTVPFYWLQVNVSAIPVDVHTYQEEHRRFMSVDGLLMGQFISL